MRLPPTHSLYHTRLTPFDRVEVDHARGLWGTRERERGWYGDDGKRWGDGWNSWWSMLHYIETKLLLQAGNP